MSNPVDRPAAGDPHQQPRRPLDVRLLREPHQLQERVLEAIVDPEEREKYYKAKVAELYANGKAVSIASVLEIDEVIDPADTRHWIMSGLRSVPKQEARTGRKRPCIDAW